MQKIKKENQKGFSLIELIVVVAIMAVLAAVLAPRLLQHLGKSRRTVDANTAKEIAESFERVFSIEKVSTSISGQSYFAVAWNEDSPMPSVGDPNNTFLDEVFLDLGKVPQSASSKHFFWEVDYEKNGHVTNIFLTDSDGVRHELYPDATAFVKGEN